MQVDGPGIINPDRGRVGCGWVRFNRPAKRATVRNILLCVEHSEGREEER